MRVLMISKACVVGAYQRKLEEIARLPDIDLSVIVPPSWDDPAGKLTLERAHLNGYGLLVEPIRFNGNYHFHYFPTLARRIRDLRPQIVHIDEEPYNLSAWHAHWLARRSGAKALFFSWQNILRRYPPPFSIGESWMLRTTDYAIMGTQSAADVFRAKGYRGPLAVIPQFGIDPSFFRPLETPHHDADRGSFTVGFIGRLKVEKGVDLLIRAVATLRDQGLDVRLRIVGQGPERESLEALAGSLNLGSQIRFDGQLPSLELAAVYPTLDALVIPSRTLPNWKEQFGRVIVEAMACGVPVIGAGSGAIPDVIGDAGLIFPENDVDSLVDRLGTLLRDPAMRTRLSAAGRERAVAHFTHAQIAAETVSVYRQMLSRSG